MDTLDQHALNVRFKKCEEQLKYQEEIRNFPPLPKYLIIKTKLRKLISKYIHTPLNLRICKKYRIEHQVVVLDYKTIIAVDTSNLNWYQSTIVYRGLYAKVFRKLLLYWFGIICI